MCSAEERSADARITLPLTVAFFKIPAVGFSAKPVSSKLCRWEMNRADVITGIAYEFDTACLVLGETTPTGQSATVAVAFLTPKQVENFLQSDFKKLAEEAGVMGARIHVERAMTADNEKGVPAVCHAKRGMQGIAHERRIVAATLWPSP